MSLDSPSPTPTPIAAAAEPVSTPKLKKHYPYETHALDSQRLKLMNLPNELLIKISLHAGFHSALTLMQVSTRFQDILMDPRSWNTYTDPSACSDILESEITICTKLHTFDHLVFGLWNQPPTASFSSSQTTLVGDDLEPSLYFEHFTFSEQYDFLGGVNVSLGKTGLLASQFFEHKESLPCYKRALVAAVVEGHIPGTAPTGDPPAGAKINHSCAECSHFNDRVVKRSIFVFDEVASHPRWGRDGFSWRFVYPDGRRVVKVLVKTFEGVVGYHNREELPSLLVKKVKVNGIELVQGEWELFQRLVQRRAFGGKKVV
ncbi:hypothetical protein HDU98_004595 [Podochytrium sp. JEL0797]|nr:hypothetical protein HDU98_004595 [Podochytrium sp. JEL0797]